MARWAADRLDPAAYPTAVTLPVLYADLDPNWHVNNVAMGRFFEHARVTSFEPLGVTTETPVHFVVARVAIDYVSEALLGTDITVGTRIARVGTTALTFEQAGWQGERCVSLCEAVVVRIEDGVAVPLPEGISRGAGPAPV